MVVLTCFRRNPFRKNQEFPHKIIFNDTPQCFEKMDVKTIRPRGLINVDALNSIFDFLTSDMIIPIFLFLVKRFLDKIGKVTRMTNLIYNEQLRVVIVKHLGHFIVPNNFGIIYIYIGRDGVEILSLFHDVMKV